MTFFALNSSATFGQARPGVPPKIWLMLTDRGGKGVENAFIWRADTREAKEDAPNIVIVNWGQQDVVPGAVVLRPGDRLRLTTRRGGHLPKLEFFDYPGNSRFLLPSEDLVLPLPDAFDVPASIRCVLHEEERIEVFVSPTKFVATTDPCGIATLSRGTAEQVVLSFFANGRLASRIRHAGELHELDRGRWPLTLEAGANDLGIVQLIE